MRLARLRLPWPEEATQTVLLLPWHNMDVQMRNALAHAIVDRDKRAFGVHALLDPAREQLDVQEERSNQLGWQILQRFVMGLGNEQRVSDEQRPIIQER